MSSKGYKLPDAEYYRRKVTEEDSFLNRNTVSFLFNNLEYIFLNNETNRDENDIYNFIRENLDPIQAHDELELYYSKVLLNPKLQTKFSDLKKNENLKMIEIKHRKKFSAKLLNWVKRVNITSFLDAVRKSQISGNKIPKMITEVEDISHLLNPKVLRENNNNVFSNKLPSVLNDQPELQIKKIVDLVKLDDEEEKILIVKLETLFEWNFKLNKVRKIFDINSVIDTADTNKNKNTFIEFCSVSMDGKIIVVATTNGIIHIREKEEWREFQNKLKGQRFSGFGLINLYLKEKITDPLDPQNFKKLTTCIVSLNFRWVTIQSLEGDIYFLEDEHEFQGLVMDISINATQNYLALKYFKNDGAHLVVYEGLSKIYQHSQILLKREKIVWVNDRTIGILNKFNLENIIVQSSFKNYPNEHERHDKHITISSKEKKAESIENHVIEISDFKKDLKYIKCINGKIFHAFIDEKDKIRIINLDIKKNEAKFISKSEFDASLFLLLNKGYLIYREKDSLVGYEFMPIKKFYAEQNSDKPDPIDISIIHCSKQAIKMFSIQNEFMTEAPIYLNESIINQNIGMIALSKDEFYLAVYYEGKPEIHIYCLKNLQLVDLMKFRNKLHINLSEGPLRNMMFLANSQEIVFNIKNKIFFINYQTKSVEFIELQEEILKMTSQNYSDEFDVITENKFYSIDKNIKMPHVRHAFKPDEKLQNGEFWCSGNIMIYKYKNLHYVYMQIGKSSTIIPKLDPERKILDVVISLSLKCFIVLAENKLYFYDITKDISEPKELETTQQAFSINRIRNKFFIMFKNGDIGILSPARTRTSATIFLFYVENKDMKQVFANISAKNLQEFGSDKTIFFEKYAKERVETKISLEENSASITSIISLPNNNFLACLDSSNFYKIGPDGTHQKIDLNQHNGCIPTALGLLHKNIVIAGYNTGEIYSFNLSTYESNQLYSHQSDQKGEDEDDEELKLDVSAIAITNFDIMIHGCRNGTTFISRLSVDANKKITMTVIKEFKKEDENNTSSSKSINAVCASRYGDFLAAGSSDRSLVIFKTRDIKDQNSRPYLIFENLHRC